MRVFIYVFLTFLIPISIGVSLLLTLYFTLEYPFAKAMSLGVLYSLIPGAILTLLFSSIFIQVKNGNLDLRSKLKIFTKKQHIQKETLTEAPTSFSEHETKIHEDEKPGEHLMLLMSKELTFELIMTATKRQVFRSIITHNIKKGSIMIKTRTEMISISTQSLTQHTSKVIIQGQEGSTFIQNLIVYLKEKEHSFLQY